MAENSIIFAGVVVLPALVILGGFTMLGLAILRGTRQAEFRHQERMAMIERGMVPPDPVMGDAGLRRAYGAKLTLGILVCGLGLALVMLIALAAGEPMLGLGIGGAFVMVGLAFVVSAFSTRRDPYAPREGRADAGGARATTLTPPPPGV
ncbi:MAG: DUF6249 domain-containing protein [Vicinamibacterales bacterium]